MYSIQATNNYQLNSTLFSGYAAMNNMRLAQALGKTGAVSPVASVGSALSSDAADFLKSYRQNMTDMLTAANRVLNPSVKDRLAAGTSDSKVAEASGKLSSPSDSYVLKVEQLASGQVNRSQQMDGGQALPAMSGRLSIKVDGVNHDFTLSSAGAKTNVEALNSFADKINAAKTGVTASVTEKNGKVSLELTGDGSKSFVVSGSLGERLGLDQAAQTAQQAVYTLSKNGGAAERFTSDSNKITLDSAVTAELKGIGTAKVTAGRSDSQALADSLQNLVDSFNGTLKFLNKNADYGIGVLSQIKRMVLPPTSEGSMKQAGLTINKDASITFDRSKFLQGMESNPSLYKNIAENFARGVQSDAKMGMRESSFNLVGSSGSSGGSSSTSSLYDMSSINFLSAYNRSGAYNMLNYYSIGALMNIVV